MHLHFRTPSHSSISSSHYCNSADHSLINPIHVLLILTLNFSELGLYYLECNVAIATAVKKKKKKRLNLAYSLTGSSEMPLLFYLAVASAPLGRLCQKRAGVPGVCGLTQTRFYLEWPRCVLLGLLPCLASVCPRAAAVTMSSAIMWMPATPSGLSVLICKKTLSADLIAKNK